MAITEKHTGSTIVLVPDSDITWHSQPELKQALDHLSATGQKHIIIDLTNVREISGYGLGLLASRCGHFRRRHGDIRLANPCETIKKLLHVTNLDELFRQFDTAEGAVHSFTVMDRGSGQHEQEN